METHSHDALCPGRLFTPSHYRSMSVNGIFWPILIAGEKTTTSQTKINHNLNGLYEPKVTIQCVCIGGRDEEEDEEDWPSFQCVGCMSAPDSWWSFSWRADRCSPLEAEPSCSPLGPAAWGWPRSYCASEGFQQYCNKQIKSPSEHWSYPLSFCIYYSNI